MRNDKYRKAFSDIYRLVETYEMVPASNDDYWKNLVMDATEIDRKYDGDPVIRKWLNGFIDGFQAAWETTYKGEKYETTI